jgi:hypothetical protein
MNEVYIKRDCEYYDWGNTAPREYGAFCKVKERTIDKANCRECNYNTVKANIYIGHANNINFKEELYKPIRASKLNEAYDIVLPHEKSHESFNSKDFLKTCGYMIAEVSEPSLGLGIEIGWANIYEIKIICIYKKGIRLSNSLKMITSIFIEYENDTDMINKLEQYFNI